MKERNKGKKKGKLSTNFLNEYRSKIFSIKFLQAELKNTLRCSYTMTKWVSSQEYKVGLTYINLKV